MLDSMQINIHTSERDAQWKTMFDVMKYNKSATLYDCLSSFIYTQFPLHPNTEVYMSKQILLSK